MKILVVADSFSRGGLETQIKTYYDNLPKDTQMIFAFANYSDEVALENANIHTGFHFTYNVTVEEFCSDVEALLEIINSENVDVIHAHPFFAYLPALFASQLARIPIVYSYHGPMSFAFLSTPICSAIFKYSLEVGALAQINAVSEIGVSCFKNMNYNNVQLFPNPIDLKKFKPAESINNNHWALFSRIDSDKLLEIKSFLLAKKEYGIDVVDIFGAGAGESELLSFIEEHQLSDTVSFKGFCSDVYNTVNKKYNGIIGIGRVVLEGLAIGMPVFLIGYGKLSGFINKQLYTKIKAANFSNYSINDTNFTFPSEEEIKEIQKDVTETLSIEAVMDKYISSLKNCQSNFVKNLESLFLEFKKLCNDEATAHLGFLSDRVVYIPVRKFIGNYTLNNNINDLFTLSDLSYYIFDTLYSSDKDIYRVLNKLTLDNSAQTEIINQQNLRIEALEKEVLILTNIEQKKNRRFHRRVIRKLGRMFKKG